MDITDRKPVKRLLLLLALGGIPFGYYLAILNPLGGPLFFDVYKMTPDEELTAHSTANMLFSLGAMLGVLFCGKAADHYGRRKMIIVYDISTIVCVLLHVVKNIYVFYFGRLLIGVIASGSSAVVSIVMAEIMPKRISGVGAAFYLTIATSFVFLSYIQQNIFSKETLVEHWRIIFAWPLLFILPKAILTPMVMRTDTPKYYMAKHSEDEDLKDQLSAIFSITHQQVEIDARVEEVIRLYHASSSKGKAMGFADLFQWDIFSRVIASLSIGVTQQLSGVGFVTLYSTDLFNRIDGSGKEATLFVAFAKASGGIISLWFMRNYGRKLNMMYGNFMQGISLICLILASGAELNIISYISVFFFAIGFAIGTGSAFYCYCAETLPPVGVSAVVATTWFLNAMVGRFAPVVAKLIGDVPLLTTFAVSCIVSVFVLDFALVETKDKSEEEIIYAFKNKEHKLLDLE